MKSSQLSLRSLLFLLAGLTALAPLAIVVELVMLFVGSQSFIVSNASSNKIESVPSNSGAASTLSGSSGFATGALSGSLVGLLGDGTPLPMALVMTGCIIMGISLRFFMQRPNKIKTPK